MFKVGDKVKVCRPNTALKMGNIHTVTSVDTRYDLIKVDTIPKDFFTNRFTLHEETLQDTYYKLTSNYGSTWSVKNPKFIPSGICCEECWFKDGKEDLKFSKDQLILISGILFSPIDKAEFDSIKNYREVKLNSELTANVFKDKIKVGCQTFDSSIVEELKKALESL